MLRFALKRLGLMVPVLLGLSILIFIWIRALPGDPARSMLGERATPEAVANINHVYGFDKPLLQQYFAYMGRLLHGDFGNSIATGDSVVSSFLDKFPATIELTIVALLFAICIGIPLGFYAGKHVGGWIDNLIVATSLLGVVIPVFFLAVLLKLVFANWLGVFPTFGRIDGSLDATQVTGFVVLDGLLTREWDAAWDGLMHLALPGIALGTIPLAIIVRITRASVAEVVDEDYVRTARAKGLPPGQVNRRAILRNALLPVVTTIGLQTGLLLSGAVLTETVFSLDGIGQYLFQAISVQDFPVLQGYILFIALIYSLVNLAVDLSYGFIDPRVRVS